jgi:hypothetical protein
MKKYTLLFKRSSSHSIWNTEEYKASERSLMNEQIKELIENDWSEIEVIDNKKKETTVIKTWDFQGV